MFYDCRPMKVSFVEGSKDVVDINTSQAKFPRRSPRKNSSPTKSTEAPGSPRKNSSTTKSTEAPE